MRYGFQNDPSFQWRKNSYEAQLREDLIYRDEDGKIMVVPSEFYTDFASIPKALWSIASPHDPKHRLSAVLHDYLYWLRGRDPYNLNRKESDLVFLRAMKSEGQSWWRRHAIYNAVRTFGGFHSRGEPWTL